MVIKDESQELVKSFINEVLTVYFPTLKGFMIEDATNKSNDNNFAFPDFSLRDHVANVEQLNADPIDIAFSKIIKIVESGSTAFAYFIKNKKITSSLEAIILKAEYKPLLEYFENNIILNTRKGYIEGCEK